VSQRTLPSVRDSAISLPVVSTTNTVSPATQGIWVLVTLRVHNLSPLDSDVAIILPPWLTMNTTP
jgi:hypothetical protein